MLHIWSQHKFMMRLNDSVLILSHVWSAFRCWQNWHIRWITHDIGTNNGRKWQRNVIILLDQKRHTHGWEAMQWQCHPWWEEHVKWCYYDCPCQYEQYQQVLSCLSKKQGEKILNCIIILPELILSMFYREINIDSSLKTLF